MAWEDFDKNGVQGVSGDRPIDEFALALKKIVVSYEDRFGRKPTVPKLLYAVETVLGRYARREFPNAPKLDLSQAMQPFATLTPEAAIDTSRYEAVYTDRTEPAYHLISQRPASPNAVPIDVLRIPTLALSGDTLTCEYDILANNLTDAQAAALIRGPLLKVLCDNYYSKAQNIEFVNLRTGKHYTEPYYGETS